MPQVGIDTSEDAMPIELGDPLIAKCNFWQILKSTKFSEAPESTKIWTRKLSNRPQRWADCDIFQSESSPYPIKLN